ncbi:MAG TPA: branched-chain amino acid ABC transporter permease [Anaerovoracaceae bacterium]|nr:branched-chain amino acid ABC transporter permease [Anaerovoracaceae bacterium]
MEAIIQTIVSGLLAGSTYALISVGIALIFGVIELVNFSHGEYLMVAMYVSFWCYKLFDIDPYASFPIVLVFMIILGFLTYKFIMQRVLHAAHEIQILATLSIMLIFQNLVLILWKADFRNVRTDYSTSSVNLSGISISFPKLIAFIVALLSAAALYLFLQKTYIGSSIRAISQNNRAAQMMGIKLNRTYCLAFTIGISLTAVAAVVLMPIYPAYPMVGQGFLLPAFITMVIGGMSNIPGVVIAGLLVGLIEALTAYLIGPEYQQIAYFILFLIVVIFKPQGIMSRKKEGV